ncbi:HyaD/HybD family hydrogenase maturation endopeptidase [Helicobacter ailurogastricus]|uniref:HyaD/HybD family hydrogenase maturation endopeptidase n=1 Tax=Helicobacter ailurogastricus TaxID=1578720 RepID=UPI000CF17B75|nr:HyaD/HybD family hydrogenase maturation endopeptidase [Helicobacter ailurogastricus]
MKILVLGIGNILLGDEGVGVHLCNQLRHNYTFSGQSLAFMDGGTMAQALIPWIVEYDRILLLDCVSVAGASMGEVFCFDFENVPSNITWAGSAHEVEMLQTLKLTALMGDLPPTTILGLIPEIVSDTTTFELSPKMLRGAQLAKEKALEILQQWGVRATPQPKPLSLQEIANNSYRMAL